MSDISDRHLPWPTRVRRWLLRECPIDLAGREPVEVVEGHIRGTDLVLCSNTSGAASIAYELDWAGGQRPGPELYRGESNPADLWAERWSIPLNGAEWDALQRAPQLTLTKQRYTLGWLEGVGQNGQADEDREHTGGPAFIDVYRDPHGDHLDELVLLEVAHPIRAPASVHATARVSAVLARQVADAVVVEVTLDERYQGFR